VKSLISFDSAQRVIWLYGVYRYHGTYYIYTMVLICSYNNFSRSYWSTTKVSSPKPFDIDSVHSHTRLQWFPLALKSLNKLHCFIMRSDFRNSMVLPGLRLCIHVVLYKGSNLHAYFPTK